MKSIFSIFSIFSIIIFTGVLHAETRKSTHLEGIADVQALCIDSKSLEQYLKQDPKARAKTIEGFVGYSQFGFYNSDEFLIFIDKNTSSVPVVGQEAVLNSKFSTRSVYDGPIPFVNKTRIGSVARGAAVTVLSVQKEPASGLVSMKIRCTGLEW